MADQERVTRPSVEKPDCERERGAERTAIGALVVHEALRIEGIEELSRPAWALAWSALAVGLSMTCFRRRCAPSSPRWPARRWPPGSAGCSCVVSMAGGSSPS